MGRDGAPGSEGLPTRTLTRREFMRYDRQLILDGFGIEGQRRLMAGRVLVIGMGALGSAASLYLAAAGVGTIGIVDGDAVEESNLSRQILYGPGDVGTGKTRAARARLQGMNPDVRVVEHATFLDAQSAPTLVSAYDVVVNGSDTFASRYLANDVAFALGRPLVDAALLRFEGQFAVFVPGSGTGCYRCLFPEPPPEGRVPTCDQAGVLGAVAGVLGSLQAAETLKLLAGIGRVPTGELLLYDALECTWERMPFGPNPACPVCQGSGERGGNVAMRPGTGEGSMDVGSSNLAVRSLSPREVAARLRAPEGVQVIDVRSSQEFAEGHIPGSVSKPWPDVATSGSRGEGTWILVCARGLRSAQAAAIMQEMGRPAYTMTGGVQAWLQEGLPWEGRTPAST